MIENQIKKKTIIDFNDNETKQNSTKAKKDNANNNRIQMTICRLFTL